MERGKIQSPTAFEGLVARLIFAALLIKIISPLRGLGWFWIWSVNFALVGGLFAYAYFSIRTKKQTGEKNAEKTWEGSVSRIESNAKNTANSIVFISADRTSWLLKHICRSSPERATYIKVFFELAIVSVFLVRKKEKESQPSKELFQELVISEICNRFRSGFSNTQDALKVCSQFRDTLRNRIRTYQIGNDGRDLALSLALNISKATPELSPKVLDAYLPEIVAAINKHIAKHSEEKMFNSTRVVRGIGGPLSIFSGVIVCLLFLHFIGAAKRSPASATFPIEECSIRIESEPAGATVMLYGHQRGVTPATLRTVCNQSVHLELKRNGYEPKSENVVVRNRENRIILSLKRIPESLGDIGPSQGAVDRNEIGKPVVREPITHHERYFR